MKTGTPCAGFILTAAASPREAGVVTPYPNNAAYKADENVSVTAEANPGYEFAGWVGLDTRDPSVSFNITANKPMVAMFRPKDQPGAATFTLDAIPFPDNGGSITRSPDHGNNTYGKDENVTVTATPNSGYIFAYWSIGTEKRDTNSVAITMNESKTMVAMFTPKIRTITVKANDENAGSVFVNGGALQNGRTDQDVGSNIVVLAQAERGYAFENWTVSAAGGTETQTGNPAIITVQDGDMTITANFGADAGGGGGQQVTNPAMICTLTVAANPDNSAGEVKIVTNGGSGNTYSVAAKVTVSATPKEGYRFAHWSSGVPEEDAWSNTVAITMDGNKKLTAEFRPAGLIFDIEDTYDFATTGTLWYAYENKDPDGKDGTATIVPFPSDDESYLECFVRGGGQVTFAVNAENRVNVTAGFGIGWTNNDMILINKDISAYTDIRITYALTGEAKIYMRISSIIGNTDSALTKWNEYRTLLSKSEEKTVTFNFVNDFTQQRWGGIGEVPLDTVLHKSRGFDFEIGRNDQPANTNNVSATLTVKKIELVKQ